YLAWRHMRRRGLQSLLTILGVAVGVMVLITALSLTNGFIDELMTSTLRATPMLSLQNYLAGDLMPEDAALAADFLEHPQVTAVAPFISGQALIARRASASLGISARQGYTQMLGIDPNREAEVLDLAVLQTQAETIGSGEGIVLGASLAQQLGV